MTLAHVVAALNTRNRIYLSEAQLVVLIVAKAVEVEETRAKAVEGNSELK